jgi:uncharacterized protein
MKLTATLRLFCLATTLATTGGAYAQAAAPRSVDAQVVGSDTFLAAHPDLRFRLLGLKAFEARKFEKAMEYFKRAARYADKPAQGMVAELLWAGQGAPMDRAAAYAWMDLAAERQFKVMLAQRERYWSALTPAEQARALEIGKAVYAEYGDAVAKPRMEVALRRARSSSTGSRTGFTGNLKIIIPGPAGDITLDGSQFYQDKFWKPADYWAWQAEEWKEMPKGRVEVGPLKVPARP